MTVWIGIDDTDSKEGGCTTYLAYRLIERFVTLGYNIIGYPRLVRLNPNIPWKTRGNGAIAIQIGKGRNTVKIGEFEKKELYSHLRPYDAELDIDRIKAIVDSVLKEMAFVSDENTNPGFVICNSDRPNKELYYDGVRSILNLDDVKKALDDIGAIYKGYKNGRGIIGAAAALAWEPEDKTYELIAYRYRERWGKKREVDEKTVIEMDKSIPSTFDNYDYRNRRVAITPNSPCPVLYGIRGDDPNDLQKAISILRGEPYTGWLIFETNQATDDHLVKREIADIRPYESVISQGRICRGPVTIEGGHVIFSIENGNVSIDCAAYEPTKEFRDIIRKLRVGDIVEVYGGVREEPFTVNIEKIKIIELAVVKRKVSNPVCPKCGKRMKSLGKNKGYRCVKCGERKGESDATFEEVERNIDKCLYEVPVCARRHLSKPLKRYGVEMEKS